jgi:hypothetical protein
VVIDSTFSRCIPALIEGAERDPRVRQFHHGYSAERRQAITDLIARGIQLGEIRSEVDSELATNVLMTSKPFDPDDSEQLVTLVLG